METDGATFLESETGVVLFTPEALCRLKRKAVASPKRRFRFCLHRSLEDPIHEMIIAFCRDTVVPIHRHEGKVETFHVIQGKLEVLNYDDTGCLVRNITLGDSQSGLPYIYHQTASVWHGLRILSEVAVVHETVPGPFDQSHMEVMHK